MFTCKDRLYRLVKYQVYREILAAPRERAPRIYYVALTPLYALSGVAFFATNDIYIFRIECSFIATY